MESCFLFLFGCFLHMQTNGDHFSKLPNLNMKIVNHFVKHVGANGPNCKHDYNSLYHIFHIYDTFFHIIFNENCISYNL
jgi:hypothetical protein